MLVSSAIRDISKRKQIEDELRHSRGRLAEAEHVAQDRKRGMGPHQRPHPWSDGLFQIYGLTPDEFDPSSQGAKSASTQTTENTSGKPSSARSQNDLVHARIPRDARRRQSPHAPQPGEVVVDDAGEPIRSSHRAGHHRRQARPRSPPEHLRRPRAPRQRATAARATHRHRTTRDTARTPHCTTARDPPADRTRPHQRGDRRTTRRHRRHDQIPRQKILAKTNSTNRTEAVARVLGEPR